MRKVLLTLASLFIFTLILSSYTTAVNMRDVAYIAIAHKYFPNYVNTKKVKVGTKKVKFTL